jgi:hypothetical protein
MDEYCTYCGSARGDRISCCGEVHFMSAKEYRDYHGEWPDDGSDDEPNNEKEAA